MLFKLPCQSKDLSEIEAFKELQLLATLRGFTCYRSAILTEEFRLNEASDANEIRHWDADAFSTYIDFTIDGHYKYFDSYVEALESYKHLINKGSNHD